ncbi:50S ribosomal protein L19 [Candidatus Dojkabacteria bacterium]|nr:50S ribosomal protein L19 [Candidatus Dojkabacteria bacterium]
MDNTIIKKIEEGFYKKRPEIKVGDTARLHLKIKEGNRERVQIFEGVVIAIKGSGLNRNIVVRKISYGVGVEKIVPLHSPMLDKIEIIKRGSVRRSKIYYHRGRVGRKALKAGDTKSIYLTDEVVVPTEGEGEEQAMPLEEEALEEEIVEEVVEEVEVTEEPTEETKEE